MKGEDKVPLSKLSIMVKGSKHYLRMSSTDLELRGLDYVISGGALDQGGLSFLTIKAGGNNIFMDEWMLDKAWIVIQ